MDLFFAELLSGLILVHAGEVAVIAFVQGLIPDGFETLLAKLVQNDFKRLLRTRENRREGKIEGQFQIPELLARLMRFRNPPDRSAPDPSSR